MPCLPRVPGTRSVSAYGPWAHPDRAAYGPAFGMTDAKLMEGAGPGEERIATFERVLCPAAIALAVAQNAIDDARVGNKGDNPHAGAAGAASQGVSLEGCCFILHLAQYLCCQLPGSKPDR
jgi:hypothetical protein